MVANYFQITGAACAVLFMFAVWPPLALLGFGVMAFLIGMALEGGN